MQTYVGDQRLRFRDALHELFYNQGGFKRLYRGIHVQMLRAFPTSASSLLVYETVQGFLKNHYHKKE